MRHPIFRFFVRRIADALPTVILVICLSFLLLKLVPGDAADVLAGESGAASPEYVAQLRERFGLNQSLPVQLALYFENVLTGNLGFSFRHNMPVSELIAGRLGLTLALMCTSIVLSITFGVALGIAAARRVNTLRDTVIALLSLIAYATPLFWIGLMLIVVFAIKLDLFPTSGASAAGGMTSGFSYILDVAHHLVLPAISLALFHMALYTRLMRGSMLEQLGLDYVRTARAKGLRERQVVYGHVLRNAILPVLTMAGVQVAALLGGSVVIESVFAWPGLGMLAYEALFTRDVNLLIGIFLLSACVVIVTNIVVDLLYVLVDPRMDPTGTRERSQRTPGA